jgi:hypothetical protein
MPAWPTAARWKFVYQTLRFGAALALLCGVAGWVRGDTVRRTYTVSARMRPTPLAMPKKVLWAWEEREDLRFVDPETAGVAYLAETLFVSDAVVARRRMQPLLLAPGTRVMAVVRIEANSAKLPFHDSEALRRAAAEAIVSVARPGIAAVQVDFDATRSQRAFYTDVLRRVRVGLPAGTPLSMTALLSWCSGDDWIAGLPVDEVVPMYFRLGREGRDPLALGAWRVMEPLCAGSVGISTDEAWPEIGPGKRVYVFAPKPWTERDVAQAGERMALKRETR